MQSRRLERRVAELPPFGDMNALLHSLAGSLLLLAAACHSSHLEPARRLASDDDIRAKILGTWTADTFEGVPGPFSLTFDADGAVRLIHQSISTNETAWRAKDGWLVIAPHGSLSSSSLDHWAIWQLDDHELVFRRGFSTAGAPERFTK